MDQEKQNGLILFIVHSKLQLTNLCQDLITQYKTLLSTEEGSFHDDIEKQFIEQAKRIVAKEIARMQLLDPEEVYIFLESFNIKEYFGLK